MFSNKCLKLQINQSKFLQIASCKVDVNGPCFNQAYFYFRPCSKKKHLNFYLNHNLSKNPRAIHLKQSNKFISRKFGKTFEKIKEFLNPSFNWKSLSEIFLVNLNILKSHVKQRENDLFKFNFSFNYNAQNCKFEYI